MYVCRQFILLLLIAVIMLPEPVLARSGSSQTFIYVDRMFNQQPAVSPPPGAVPEPQKGRVQVYIYKKGTVFWTLPLASQAGVPSRTGATSPPLKPTDPRLGKIIAKYANQQGLDPRLVQVVIRHESGFDPGAVSPKGAMGLMQLMPETAASMGVEDPFDVEQNIKGGVRFLKICLNRFNQNLPLALAAYNAGPGRVVEHQGMPPFKETHDYVKKVVMDYSGQALDPAQVKIQPAASTAATAEPPATPPAMPEPTPTIPQLFSLPVVNLAGPEAFRGAFQP